MNQTQIDKLADVMWWIRGAIESRSLEDQGLSLDGSHIEALRKARIVAMEANDAKEQAS